MRLLGALLSMLEADLKTFLAEHMWAQLIEEATRVLSPGCKLLDASFRSWRD